MIAISESARETMILAPERANLHVSFPRVSMVKCGECVCLRMPTRYLLTTRILQSLSMVVVFPESLNPRK